mmetsp:Transcript_17287/g.48687  ORF Transcript_17287/g.48687 Transcript_17287/m.48687 type:complete len:239 (-) Transcript_17287:1686-2402(-)|eukprot:CAMPEP_0119546042 /NCGR_PEP_ID=MMETSP1352-20130426/614_1 /TAXON_ID=265584 /ORGANISM="Stauroneis constricta, Strain CCMP1120" /LENGTH=238 /DNA_ID=CAMNT_0007590695 /DNA_START=410 /DNA_END=1126 /DNA_ORIENTATION=+
MGDFFRRCPDGHRCENRSTCTEDANNEGNYFCDCSTSSTPHVGLYCEFPAEVKCSFPQEVSETWYCANKGTCVLDVDSSQTTMKCDCPPEYEGDFCEYVSGSVPSSWPVGVSAQKRSNTGGNSKGLEDGVMAIIIVIALAFVGLTAYIIIRKRRSAYDADEKADSGTPTSQKADPSEALNIETDGSKFRDIVRSMSSPHGDDLDFETAEAASVEVGMERARSPTFESNDTASVGGRII